MPVTITNASAATPSWAKVGSAANAAYNQAKFKQEQAAEASKRMWRFYLKVGEERAITFLDGDLDDEGVLNMFSFNEHNLQVAGEWKQFVCVSDTEICPLCNSGNKPRFVGVLTVIDHTPYEIKKGPKAGQIIKNQRKLFVATFQTVERLRHFASKRGGLRGWKIEVSRLQDKDPAVGSTFQFENQTSPEKLVELYAENGVPADYSQEIAYLSAKELLGLGLGSAAKGPGFEKKLVDVEAAADQM